MSTRTLTVDTNYNDILYKTGVQTGLAWTRSGTTITLTFTNHTMAVSESFYVTVSSDTGAIPIGAKTVATVVNADSLTFTGVNTGATSGTLTLFSADNYTLNGCTLTLDSDTHIGENNPSSAVLGNVTISATLGGKFLIDTRAVRLVPYDSGSGNVPAIGTVVSQGGASGKLIGVYSSLAAGPSGVGAAMPATGYIKLRQVTGTFAAGALTGIGASSTGAATQGWIDARMQESTTITVPRIGSFEVRGGLAEIPGVTTSGSRATTYALPSNGATYIPGVFVGDAADGALDRYPCAGSLTALVANVGTDSVRGKLCWVSTGGVLRFGHDGTNSTGGYVPASGKKIFFPSVLTHCVAQASATLQALPNATLGTRPDLTTTGGGQVYIDGASLTWYPSVSQAYSLTVLNSVIAEQLYVSEVATEVVLTNVIVGQVAAQSQTGLLASLLPAGINADHVTWTRAAAASSGNYAVSLADIQNASFTDETACHLALKGNATTGSHVVTRCTGVSWATAVGQRYALSYCDDVSWDGFVVFDGVGGNTTSANPRYGFDFTYVSNFLLDNYADTVPAMTQPYSGLITLLAGCRNGKIRRIGTPSDPALMGGDIVVAAAYSRTTTTATVTKTAHGLAVNDTVYVLVSDSVAAIVVGAKTVASAPSADTFTFACLNAGAASGVVTYVPQKAAYLILFGAGAACVGIKLQQISVIGLRTNLYSLDNSSSDILVESVREHSYIMAPVPSGLKLISRNTGAVTSVAAQTAVYGTHWNDTDIQEGSANTSAQTWSRTTTTATCTSTDHGLQTNARIVVTVSSDTSAIVLGVKTITVLTKDTFTFTCLNAGAASGTLSFVPENSRITLHMNEPTADTAGQYSVVSGTPSFTAAGTIYMPTVGQEAEWVMPSYVYNHTSFPIDEAVMAGGTLTNHNITYAIDKNDGAGFSAFRNLSYCAATFTGSSGSAVVTVGSTEFAQIAVGDYCFGTNVAPAAKVLEKYPDGGLSANQVRLDKNHTGTLSGVGRFNYLPNETVASASTGLKLKIRIATRVTNTAAISSLLIYSSRPSGAQVNPYVLDTVSVTVAANVTLSGAEIRIYDLDNSPAGSLGTELSGIESNSGSTYNFSAVPGNSVWVQVMKSGYVEFGRELVIPDVDGTYSIVLQADLNA